MGPPNILAQKEGKVVLHLSILPSSSSSKKTAGSSRHKSASATPKTPVGRRLEELRKQEEQKREQEEQEKLLATVNDCRDKVKDALDTSAAAIRQQEVKQNALNKKLQILTSKGNKLKLSLEKKSKNSPRGKSQSRSHH